MDDLEHILRLAKAERDARVSGSWKADMEAAFERHADCIDALFAELYRQLDQRAGAGEPVIAAKHIANVERDLRKKIEKEVKADLQDIVDRYFDGS